MTRKTERERDATGGSPGEASDPRTQDPAPAPPLPVAACPSDEELEALVGGALPADAETRLRAHLAGCSACRQALDEWQFNLPFADTVKTALHDVDTLIDHDLSSPADMVSTEALRGAVSGYEILEELHQGAQGLVCRGVHRASGRPVALKFLNRRAGGDEAGLRRFDREIELARGLHHPGIIRVRDRGITSSGKHYYVMDFVAGPPLHHYVWDSKLPIDATLKLFLSVCEAVNYAHQRGVLHRDLKPSNILVDTDGVPRVLDFGLAKQIVSAPEALLSITGQVFGTLPYMSPEQVAGRAEEVDIRADVYALGVILYQILTGTFPYPVSGPVPEVLRHITTTLPAPPSQVWRAGMGVSTTSRTPGGEPVCPIAEDLDTIILRTLAKEPQRRYQNVAALAEDISRYQRGQPIEAKREAGFSHLSRRLARYRAAATLTGIGAIVIALFASVLAYMYQEQVRTSKQAAQDRQHTIEAQVQLGEALLQLGDNEVERNNEEDALGQYLAALTIYQHLAIEEFNNLIHQERIADSLMRLGDLERRRGDMVRATDYYRRFRDLANELVANYPQRRLFQERAARARQRWEMLTVNTQPASQPASEPAPASD